MESGELELDGVGFGRGWIWSWVRESWSWTGLDLESEWGTFEEEWEELVGVGRGDGGLGARRVGLVEVGV